MGNNTWNLIQSSKRPIHHLHISHNKLLFSPTILHNRWPDSSFRIFRLTFFNRWQTGTLRNYDSDGKDNRKIHFIEQNNNKFLGRPCTTTRWNVDFLLYLSELDSWNNREKFWKDAKSVFRGVLIRVVIVAHSEVHNQSVLLTWLKVINEFIITCWIGISISWKCYIP